MKTREQKRAEYLAKQKVIREQREKENNWFAYKMNICSDKNYTVFHGQYEYIMYQIDQEFHADFVNDEKFVFNNYKECIDFTSNYLMKNL